MLYALSFMAMFTIGGLTGVFLGALAVDVHLHDTYFVVGHFHYVMVGGTVISFIAGLYHWWPKMSGRMYSEFWSRAACVVVFIGFNMTFLSQLVMGSKGMPRRYASYDSVSPALREIFQFWHQLSTTGSMILGIGFFMAAGTLIWAWFRGPTAGSNPWRGATLEWKTTSPPIAQNFEDTPTVTRGPYDYS
jgi:cytochrome c oxidase subunit 1